MPGNYFQSNSALKLMPTALVFLWAGLVLGGSLVAAPAKFEAPSLTLPTALEVGRAQFFWIGVSEGVLCVLYLGAVYMFGGLKWRIAILPVAIFAVQRLIILPPLDERTLQVIAGESVGESYLHVIFGVLEYAKVLTLIAVGAMRSGVNARDVQGSVSPGQAQTGTG